MITALALAGIAVSAYAYSVQRQPRGVRRWCDFRESMRCSTALRGPYSRLLGTSNALVGIAFYLAVLTMERIGSTLGVQALALCGLVASGILAYLGYVRQRTFCVVCTTTYAINIAIAVQAW